MIIDELKACIDEVTQPTLCSAEFYFLLGRDGQFDIKRVDVASDAKDVLVPAFLSAVRGQFGDTALSVRELSLADERDNVVYQYDLPTMPGRMAVMATLLAHDNFEAFTFDGGDFAQLEAILILLGHGDQQMVLYKHHYQIELLKQSSFSLFRMARGDRFVRVTEDILRLNAKFEIVFVAGEYYITDLKTVERFLGFHEAVRNVAAQGVRRIAQSGLVEDTQVLTDRFADVAFARKLARIASSSPVLGIVPNESVFDFIVSHPTLSGKFHFTEDRSCLRLDTKVSQDLFLKLMNDDFLTSQLTKRHYDSIAKDDVRLPETPSPDSPA